MLSNGMPLITSMNPVVSGMWDGIWGWGKEVNEITHSLSLTTPTFAMEALLLFAPPPSTK